MRLLEVRKIWDIAPHNAFTDLVRFNNNWFCVFREGETHVSSDGCLRIIYSEDGKNWRSVAKIESTNSDLRDAKITVTPNGELMLCGAEAFHVPNPHTHQSLAWFSRDGVNWSEKHLIGDKNIWLWRVTWFRKKAYGMGYGCGEKNRVLRLYTSLDGKVFSTVGDYFRGQGYANETSIVFRDDKAYCLLRRDDEGETAMIGTASFPFSEWTWKDLGVWLGGPHLLLMPGDRLLAAVRIRQDGGEERRTVLGWIDPKKSTFEECLVLPSGGDTSYAGMVFHKGILNLSYYSSHEGKTAIYFAKVEASNKA
tara:strand:+ start:3705 stop:4631 length:927 start_codon:yes stop_codon:yes gene_type:complete